jgi:hypothetical protein
MAEFELAKSSPSLVSRKLCILYSTIIEYTIDEYVANMIVGLEDGNFS